MIDRGFIEELREQLSSIHAEAVEARNRAQEVLGIVGNIKQWLTQKETEYLQKKIKEAENAKAQTRKP